MGARSLGVPKVSNNPSVGRFLSVDPLKDSYPWYTPYQFAGNTPIQAIDLDGLEEYIVTYIYNNIQLLNLEVRLNNPDANYTRIRVQRDVNDMSPQMRRGYIPPNPDKLMEDRFFRLLRNQGNLTRILAGTAPEELIVSRSRLGCQIYQIRFKTYHHSTYHR